MIRSRPRYLSIALLGDDPPSEFRIFTAGKVDTVKGAFLFDATAAELVMTEYLAHGIDLMVDYDHASLGVGVDPALSGKSAGWFELELRDGELWAVNVRWTPPAFEALKRKEWRFMSPAFTTDADERVTSLLNVALTNLPATRRLEPLMAANLVHLGERSPMALSAELVSKALEALASGDADTAMSILKDMIAAAASGEEESPGTEAEPPMLSDGGGDPNVEDDKAATMAAASRLTRLTGKTSIAAAVDEVEVWRRSHLALEADTKKLAVERAALELNKRKENAITLTKLGAETPFTTGLGTKSGKLCKRLTDEPLEEQNERVAALLAARGGKLTEIHPPSSGEGGVLPNGARVVTLSDGSSRVLSAREIAMCADKKIDLTAYAATKPKKDH